MKLKEFMKIAVHLPEDMELIDIVNIINKEHIDAFWEVWGGWSGNHDRRIENAKCSSCGYTHHTVYGSLSNLAVHCPYCGARMGTHER